MDNVVQLTIEGKKKLEDERKNLIEVERPKVIEEIAFARSQGDLSENADYDAARDKQAHIEARIKEIEVMLENAKIIESADIDKSTVQMGAIVTIENLDETKEAAYKIVGSFETDPFNGKISNECPLAKAIIGHGINEIVSVGVAKPYEVRIKAISYEA
ncbi:transcription elongation factor GreA [Sharpea azabuensis]|uniref:transcription elongation factor GreA n=1 Tax=Sharpea azabuensis TaxID=322505 RepID=UPI00051BDF22|nr:transcription elongation factor GreA [Sharpea azabuensis]